MNKLNIANIISTLLTAAIIFLFTSISELNNNVAELGKHIAVMQEHDSMIEQDWQRRLGHIDDLTDAINQLSNRVQKLEWQNEKQSMFHTSKPKPCIAKGSQSAILPLH